MQLIIQTRALCEGCHPGADGGGLPFRRVERSSYPPCVAISRSLVHNPDGDIDIFLDTLNGSPLLTVHAPSTRSVHQSADIRLRGNVVLM